MSAGNKKQKETQKFSILWEAKDSNSKSIEREKNDWVNHANDIIFP
jgi:hypothetical protein